jgi:signal transduction histidine kinase
MQADLRDDTPQARMCDMEPSSDQVRQVQHSRPVWVRTLAFWHVIFYAVLAMTLVTSLIDNLTAARRTVVVALLVVAALGHWFIGRPAATSRRRRPANVYRLLLIACCGGAVALHPQSIFLLFVVCPQIWLLTERALEGIFFSVLLLTVVGAGELYAAGWTWDAFWGNLPWLLVSLGSTLLLGVWNGRVVTMVEQVIKQSELRGELIAQLESTRDELAEAHHAAGAMAERERMAREIHDTLAQGMTSIVMLAQAAQVELQRGGSDPAGTKLAAIEETARENLAEARALVAAFTPVALSGATLTEVLRRQAERFAAETGVDVQVSLDLPDEELAVLPQGQQVVVLRAAQESLANVRKHAGATQVRITLGIAADGICIEIRDDGLGFEPQAPASGFGLAAMRGRVEESGGTVQVDSAPGRGTRVQVLIPAAGQEAL